MPDYVARFKKVFPRSKDPVSFENMAKAIADFESTLTTPDSPFDRFLKGDTNALSKQAKQGLTLFMDKGCSGCHNGINVGGGMYQPFGVVEKPGADILPREDKGRFAVTKTVSDEYVYKVPTLRNIALTAPYFHSGKVWSLKQAVGVMGTAQLGIKITDNEAEKIVAFLTSLTGKQPEVTMPILPPITASTPGPVLDIGYKTVKH
jgi:cytochrome c peroxidase